MWGIAADGGLCSYGPLYTAMTTGFCGSVTTFSGWQLDVFQSWLNVNRDHRDWFRDVSSIAYTCATLKLNSDISRR